MGRRKRKKPVCISRTVAVERLDAMMPLIFADVRIALATEANLVAANEIVLATPDERRPGARAYNSVHQSLVLNLAVSLARLFDEGGKKKHPNRRDVASIPLLLRLLRQKRCRKVLIDRARVWTPMVPAYADLHENACNRAIDDAINAFSRFAKSHPGRAALARLRNFRNNRLAHSLMLEALNSRPLYNDLFRLMDVAREVADAAHLAIQGMAPDLEDLEQAEKEEADAFWRSAFGYEPPEVETENAEH